MKPTHVSTIPLIGREHIEPAAKSLHPAWREFVSYCEKLQFGEILKIQDGLPFWPKQ
jgi:hypothetical protein